MPAGNQGNNNNNNDDDDDDLLTILLATLIPIGTLLLIAITCLAYACVRASKPQPGLPTQQESDSGSSLS